MLIAFTDRMREEELEISLKVITIHYSLRFSAVRYTHHVVIFHFSLYHSVNSACVIYFTRRVQSESNRARLRGSDAFLSFMVYPPRDFRRQKKRLYYGASLHYSHEVPFKMRNRSSTLILLANNAWKDLLWN